SVWISKHPFKYCRVRSLVNPSSKETSKSGSGSQAVTVDLMYAHNVQFYGVGLQSVFRLLYAEVVTFAHRPDPFSSIMLLRKFITLRF
ncbi:hypothetical protein J6590_019198, partial [Homalodisca vitripennis]